MRKFITYNLQFTILTFTFYILHFTFLKPVYADVKIGEQFGFGKITSLGTLISTLVPTLFSVAGAAVVIYFLIGAFKFLSSGGDKEAVAGARGMITHAIIGFIILMFTFLILQFLLSSIFKITDYQIIK